MSEVAILFLILVIGSIFASAWIVIIYPMKRLDHFVSELQRYSVESTWNAPFKDAFASGYLKYYGRISETTGLLLVRYSSTEYVNDYTFLGLEIIKKQRIKRTQHYPRFYGNMFRRMFLLDVQRNFLSSAPIEEKFKSKLLRGVIDSEERQILFYSLGDKTNYRFNKVIELLKDSGYLNREFKSFVPPKNEITG